MPVASKRACAPWDCAPTDPSPLEWFGVATLSPESHPRLVQGVAGHCRFVRVSYSINSLLDMLCTPTVTPRVSNCGRQCRACKCRALRLEYWERPCATRNRGVSNPLQSRLARAARPPIFAQGGALLRTRSVRDCTPCRSPTPAAGQAGYGPFGVFRLYP